MLLYKGVLPASTLSVDLSSSLERRASILFRSAKNQNLVCRFFKSVEDEEKKAEKEKSKRRLQNSEIISNHQAVALVLRSSGDYKYSEPEEVCSPFPFKIS
jgi:hypothetical protein